MLHPISEVPLEVPVAETGTVWHVLSLCLCVTEVGGARYTMPARERRNVFRMVQHLGPLVSSGSKGLGGVKHDIIFSELPVRARNFLGPGYNNSYWLTPTDLPEHAAKYEFAKYDALMFYVDGPALGAGPYFGLTLSSQAPSTPGWTTIFVQDTEYFDPRSHEGEGAVHEFLHHLEGYYQSKGFLMPGVDIAGNYGYTYGTNMGALHNSWLNFYNLYLSGQVIMSGVPRGVTSAAWAKGTPVTKIVP